MNDLAHCVGRRRAGVAGLLSLTSLLWLLSACGDMTDPSVSPAPSTRASALEVAPSPNGVYIVVLSSGDPEAVAASAGVTPNLVYRHALDGFAAPLSPAALSALSSNPRVRFIQPDSEVHVIADVVPTGVDRMEVDLNTSVPPRTPIDVDVAVIDTGIDYTHPDLNVVARTNCARGGPFGSSCRDNDGTDGYGHGTHVAGTIAAKSDGIGVTGVAPGARLWSVRVLDNNGSGWTSWVIAGIDYVTAHAGEIEVANMSLGGSGSDDTDGGNCEDSLDAENLAICNSVAAGVVYVVAAGNESDDAANHTPAAYDQVITVSALSDFDGIPGGKLNEVASFSSCTEAEDDSLACFSNYGHDVDLMAPGVWIYSTYPGGGYATFSGTSMASPHVAGLAALYLDLNPAATPADVRQALVDSALPQGHPCGLTTFDDPDQDPNNHEPVAFANAIALGGDGTCEGGCSVDADCDDGDACTGIETCVGGACQVGTPVTCTDDGDACTVDTCNPADGTCSYPALVCDDGDACNGSESCNPASGCVAGTPVTCSDGDACTVDTCDPTDGTCSYPALDCDDGELCTLDSCNSVSGCVYDPNPDPVCSCGGNQSACTVDEDCCSGNCRGGTCRGN